MSNSLSSVSSWNYRRCHSLSSVSCITVGAEHEEGDSFSVLMFPISCDFLFHYIHMCYFIYLDYDVRFITGFTVGSVLLLFFSFLCCVFVFCPRSVSFTKCYLCLWEAHSWLPLRTVFSNVYLIHVNFIIYHFLSKSCIFVQLNSSVVIRSIRIQPNQ